MALVKEDGGESAVATLADFPKSTRGTLSSTGLGGMAMDEELSPDQVRKVERIVDQRLSVIEGRVDELASSVEVAQMMLDDLRSHMDKHIEFAEPRLGRLERSYQRLGERIEALFPRWRSVWQEKTDG